MKFKFSSLTELLEILHSENISLEDYAVKREASLLGISEKSVLYRMENRIGVTRSSLIKGLAIPQYSKSGLTKAAASLYFNSQKKLLDNELFRRTAAYSLAINEVNACGGRIAAFPTAGSSGIVSGAIWAWWDVKNNAPMIPVMDDLGLPKKLIAAFLVSAMTGVIISQNATLAGAEGGCQAECGSAAAMAASALVYLEDLSTEDSFNAAALSLKNSLGLACDPVAGLVEVPCVKRNGFSAVNALLAADMTMAGIKSIIPFDDVVMAMKEIGEIMPSGIKENAEGGLAVTPGGLEIKKKLS